MTDRTNDVSFVECASATARGMILIGFCGKFNGRRDRRFGGKHSDQIGAPKLDRQQLLWLLLMEH